MQIIGNFLIIYGTSCDVLLRNYHIISVLGWVLSFPRRTWGR